MTDKSFLLAGEIFQRLPNSLSWFIFLYYLVHMCYICAIYVLYICYLYRIVQI